MTATDDTDDTECWELLVPGPTDTAPEGRSFTGLDCHGCGGPGYLLGTPPRQAPDMVLAVRACPQCRQLEHDGMAAKRAALHRGWRTHCHTRQGWFIVPQGVPAW